MKPTTPAKAVYKAHRRFNRIMTLIDAHRRRLELREAQITTDVVFAKDDAGKYKYSNEHLRTAALAQQKENDPRWKSYAARLVTFEAARREAFARLELARDTRDADALARREALALREK